MEPLPRCQFVYDDDAQCIWIGATEAKPYCNEHNNTIKSRKRADLQRERKKGTS